MTSQPMDVDEDRDAKIARRIEEQAHDTAEGAAAAASDAEETLDDVITEAKGLRKMIMSGVVSTDDVRRALVGLRRRHEEVADRVPSIKIAYEGAAKTIEDPAARVAELRSRFGSFQR
jgi:hypothetical protein